jgi:hypothetical protein
MKKIKTLFKIDRETNLATTLPNEDTDWVFNGEGKATIKFDGTACMVKDGVLYKRYDRKLQGKYAQQARQLNDQFQPMDYMFNTLPENAIPCEEKPDPKTFHFPHWVPVSKDNPADKFHVEAFAHTNLPDGTYELVGPKINGNPYQLTTWELWKHGANVVDVKDRSYEAIQAFLKDLNGEGLVFHHDDGRMVKIRRKDFGYFWNKEDVRDNKPKQTVKLVKKGNLWKY